MGDAGGELAERSKLIRLHQAVLSGAQIVQRFCQFPCAGLNLVEQPSVFDRDDRLVGERLHELDLLVNERMDLLARQREHSNRLAARNSGTASRVRAGSESPASR